MAIVLATQNRFYAAREASFGKAASVGAENRLAGLTLDVRQQYETPRRRDKTGSRTWQGPAAGRRKRTEFSLTTYLQTNIALGSPPAVGPLVEAAMGGAPLVFSGTSVGGGSGQLQLSFSGSHGLKRGQGLVYKGEIRFVERVVSSTAVELNAPFTAAPQSGQPLSPTVTYPLAANLPSVCVFDYWEPSAAVSRVVVGGLVDTFEARINGDYHELEFSGPARDAIDNVTFRSGEGGASAFPAEPPLLGAPGPPVLGHLGQAWLGAPLSSFSTLTSARVRVDNAVQLRDREFGVTLPLGGTPGERTVTAEFELLEADDAATRGLYAAARQQAPVGVMFQLGAQAGALMGVYAPAALLEPPAFGESDAAVSWTFRNSRAQGGADDEVFIAFG